jgi:hypothetical protein
MKLLDIGWSGRSVVTAAALLMPAIALTAPPPPPERETSQARTQLREAINQLKRFEAAGLKIPSPPANGGQCIVDTSGSLAPPAGQRGVTETYRLYEIHRWEVSAAPSNPGQYPLSYPLKWTSTGNGERHADNGVGTRNDWTFTISGQNASRVAATRIASSGNWLIQLVPTSAPSSVLVVQQVSVTGMTPPLPVTTRTLAPAVGYPSMTAAATPPNIAARVAEMKTFRVPTEMNWGYPRPAYATGSIACTWNLAVGP